VTDAWHSLKIRQFEHVAAGPSTALLRISGRASRRRVNAGPRPTLLADDGLTVHRFEPLPSPPDARGVLRAAYSVTASAITPDTVFALRLTDGTEIRLPAPTPSATRLGPRPAAPDAQPAPAHDLPEVEETEPDEADAYNNGGLYYLPPSRPSSEDPVQPPIAEPVDDEIEPLEADVDADADGDEQEAELAHGHVRALEERTTLLENEIRQLHDSLAAAEASAADALEGARTDIADAQQQADEAAAQAERRADEAAAEAQQRVDEAAAEAQQRAEERIAEAQQRADERIAEAQQRADERIAEAQQRAQDAISEVNAEADGRLRELRTTLEASIAEVTARADEATARSEAAQARAEALQERNAEVESALAEHQQRVGSLERELAETQHARADLAQEVDLLKAARERYQHDLQQSQDEVRAMTLERDELNRQAAAFDAVAVKARQRASLAEEASAASAATLSELETWRSELERRLSETTSELELARATTADDALELRRLRGELAESEAKLELAQADMRNLNRRLEALGTDGGVPETDQSAELERLTAEIAQLRTQRAERAAEGDPGTLEQLQDVEEQRDEYARRAAQLEAERAEIGRRAGQLAAMLAPSKHLAELTDDLALARAQAESLQAVTGPSRVAPAPRPGRQEPATAVLPPASTATAPAPRAGKDARDAREKDELSRDAVADAQEQAARELWQAVSERNSGR
jgi:chromosome segregation ATPase